MATYAWLMNHGRDLLKDKQPKPLVIAWNKNSKEVMDPCDKKDPKNPNQSGCKNFMGVNGMNYDVQNTKALPYDDMLLEDISSSFLRFRTGNRGGGGRGGGRGGGKLKRELAFEA